METRKNFIYIFTNPGYQDMVKIGYTKDVEARRKGLNSSGVRDAFEIYAVCETSSDKEHIDKTLHKLIDTLNPDLRYDKNKEFYKMTPEQAYSVLKVLVEFEGIFFNLKRYKKPGKKGAAAKESMPEKVLYEINSNISPKETKNPLSTARLVASMEAQLIEEGFKGNKGLEIARRLGFAEDKGRRKMVYDYLEFSRLIPLIQNLAITEDNHRSNFLRIAKYDLLDQKAIYDILIDAKKDNFTLTRAHVKYICDQYKNGCRSWEDIKSL